MIKTLVTFELTNRLKLLSTYVYAVVFFFAGFFIMLAAGGVFRGVSVSAGNDRVLANAPHAVFTTTMGVAMLGLFAVAAVFGQAAYQDFGHNTWMIIFTKKVKKGPYLVGRFLGAYLFSAVLFLAIAVGEFVGTGVVHLVSPENLGDSTALKWLWPYLLAVWPMLFFAGAVFFTLAAVTRRMAPVYVGVVVLVLGYLLAQTLLRDVQNERLSSLLDPFGFAALHVATRYLTPAERNHELVPFMNLYGLNRLVWSGLGLALLALAINRFRPMVEEQRGARAEGGKSSDAVAWPKVKASVTTLSWVRTSLSLGAMYFREILRSPVYWTFIVAGLGLVAITLSQTKQIFGTSTLPVTYQVLELAIGSFSLFSLISVTFYAGEIVWRDRDVRLNEIIDATRVPTWVGFTARLGALTLLALSLELVVGAAALSTQVLRGFFDIDLKQYLVELFCLHLTSMLLLSALALVVQVLVNNKYLGHFAMVGYYVTQSVFSWLGVEDRLLEFGAEPSAPYSDMNGYGHFLVPVLWFRLYWGAISLALLALAYLFMSRGRDDAGKTRRFEARRRFQTGSMAVLAVGLVLAVGAGGVIFYNTHLLHPYHTSKDTQRDQARYEKTYQKYASTPQPTIIGADVNFDIYPSQRRLHVTGLYRLKNKTTEPVTRVVINTPNSTVVGPAALSGEAAAVDVDVEVRELALSGVSDHRPSPDDDPGRGLYFLDVTLAPGDERDLKFDFDFHPKGFRHSGASTDVVGNGTFFNNFNLPMIGYQRGAELTLDKDRKEYDLAPKERMAPRDDVKEQQHNYIRQDSDFITFAATVSTDADQIAIAPGYVEKEWVENGRPHWRYVMDQPILNFFSVLSARYVVKRDEWQGVKLEIYSHPSHSWNLDRMMTGMKDALAYCSTEFGPYQHKQARILEFPRYQSFAQSFPNTIPYSEAVGFIARVRENEPDDIDYPYYITAHEIAHQWWAHQVVGANVRGATMTSESMAEYTALMIMKKKFGPEKMRRFLKFELDRYLVGRVMERKKELPLAHNENQMYIHYAKGSVAMYALQDFIGEATVNRALKKYVEAWRFKGPPYTTAGDLVAALRAETPAEYAYLIDDLFETITLYDNRALSATMKQNPAGTWDVTLKVKAAKFRSDDKGTQTELDFEDWVDVGALNDKDEALWLEKRRVKKGDSTLTFTVPTKPARVGIDPMNKLIDRTLEDNLTTPSQE